MCFYSRSSRDFQTEQDDDDDNDGISDVEDSHPYDATITTSHTEAGNMFETSRTWTFNEYRTYSGGVDYVAYEAARVSAAGSGFGAMGAVGTPAFSTIVDGDLDSDGIPNFLDPDNDNDGTLNSQESNCDLTFDLSNNSEFGTRTCPFLLRNVLVCYKSK